MSAATYAAQRARFVDDSISTASPARLLTMLFDRLLLDLSRAEVAQVAGDRAAANTQLLHAQDIVLQLATSLRADEWEGGPGLAALYAYLHTQLVQANVAGDPAKTAECRSLIEPLADAWRTAALDPDAQAALAARAG